MKERINWLDYAKGVGIILVVYGHAMRGIHDAGLPLSASVYSYSDALVYSFHMPLFFFISGMFFVSSFVSRGANYFLINKAKVILYPYLVWSIFQTGIEAFMSSYTNQGIGFSEITRILYQPRAQFWFLYELFKMFALCALIYKFLPRYAGYVSALAAIIILIVNEATGLKIIHNYFVFFVMGIAFNEYRKGQTKREDRSGGVLFIPVFIIFAHLAITYNIHENLFVFIPLAILGVAFVISISKLMAEKSIFPAISYLGKLSMPIYLAHIICASGTRIALKMAGVESVAIYLAAGMIAGIVLPIIAYNLCKKYGFLFIFEYSPVNLRRFVLKSRT